MDFYTAVIVGIVGAIVAFAVVSFYYNKKWVPYQHRKGSPAQPLTRLANNMLKNGYSSKEPFEWLQAKRFGNISYKTKKLFSLRNLNLLMNIITVALIALQNENWWFVPVLQTIVNIIAYSPQHQQRNAIVSKMCLAAHKKLSWGATSLLTPWVYVRVSEWDKNSPTKVVLKLNSDYDATNPATREGFERQFNSNVSGTNNWSYEWNEAEGNITLTPVALLPENAPYEGAEKYDWNVFPVGIGTNGPVTYNIEKYPHVLVGGTTGSGKSVLQRNIIFHCIQHNYMWRFLGVDLKRVELGPFKKYEETVMGVASELEDGVEIVRYAQRVMNTRYTQMEEAGVNHFKNLIDPKTGKTKERAILVMVDEAAMFMGTEGVKTDEGKARDELHGEAVGIIGALARLGRAAGVHLLLATQRPDATFIPGETKANLDVRIAAGRLDSTPSSMILDSGAATMLPGNIKGRGVIRYAGQNQEFQGYLAEQDWIDAWLMEHPGVEPTIQPKPGQVTDKELDDLAADIDFDDGILALEADIMSDSTEQFAEEAMGELKELDLEDSEPKKGFLKKRKKKDKKEKASPSDDDSTLDMSKPYLEMDDDDDDNDVYHEPEIEYDSAPEPLAPLQEKSHMSSEEVKLHNKMKEVFGEEIVDEAINDITDNNNPFADFEVKGVPDFDPEGSPTVKPASQPERAEPKSLPAFKPPTRVPSLPSPSAAPVKTSFPAPKGFPSPPSAANLPKISPPKNFPPPPKH